MFTKVAFIFICILYTSFSFATDPNYPHYGEIYVNYIHHKSEPVSQSDEIVEEAIPLNTSYRNEDRICSFLSKFSTELFFNTDNFEQYMGSMSGVLEEISQMTAYFIKNLDFDRAMNKYKHYYTFINTNDLPDQIAKASISLEPGKKIAILLGTSNHVSSILIQRHHDQQIEIIFYDPFLTVVFRQLVSVERMEALLKNSHYFTHPKSILNPNNVLFGEIALLNDSLDTQIAVSTLHFVVEKSTHFEKPDLVDKKLGSPKLLNSLSNFPGILFEFLITASKDKKAINSFLQTYGSSLKEKWKKTQNNLEKFQTACDSNYMQDLVPSIKMIFSKILSWVEKADTTKFIMGEETLSHPTQKFLVMKSSVPPTASTHEQIFAKIQLEDLKLFYSAMKAYEKKKNGQNFKSICQTFKKKNIGKYTVIANNHFKALDEKLSKKQNPQITDEL